MEDIVEVEWVPLTVVFRAVVVVLLEDEELAPPPPLASEALADCKFPMMTVGGGL